MTGVKVLTPYGYRPVLKVYRTIPMQSLRLKVGD